jgi:hypothetical protein
MPPPCRQLILAGSLIIGGLILDGRHPGIASALLVALALATVATRIDRHP